MERNTDRCHMSWCTFPAMLHNALCIIYIQHPCIVVFFVQFIYIFCVVVICGGETPSIFFCLNDLVSNRLHELPGEQLVCILIKPGNHLSEVVTASLILLLTASMLCLLLWMSHFYICSICIKSLDECEQTSMEDMQNTPRIGPQWLQQGLPASCK